MASKFVSTFAQVFRQDFSDWLDSLAAYLLEVKPDRLNLGCRNIGPEEIELVLQLISRSQITKLILVNNNLSYALEDLQELLIRANIKKLDVTGCELLDEDFLHLMEVCRKTELTKLEVLGNDCGILDEERATEVISLLPFTRLTSFDFSVLYPTSEVIMPTFLQILPHTSLTRLDLSNHDLPENVLISLFSNLCFTQITDLDLYEVLLYVKPLKELSQNLKFSKLEKLNLSSNHIDDDGIDILVTGLIQSKIINLDLSCNKFQGLNTLGYHLKDTCIRTLNLSGNRMQHHGIFLSPDFLRNSSVVELDVSCCPLEGKIGEKLLESLKFSKVTYLNISGCDLQSSTILKFAEIVKDTNLEFVNFSDSNLSFDTVIILGRCMKESKIKEVLMSRSFKQPYGGILASRFLEETKKSSLMFSKHGIKNVMSTEDEKQVKKCHVQREVVHANGSAMVYLSLLSCEISSDVTRLAESLKFTALTSLSLHDNKITDEGVEALAASLKGTQIVALDLSRNLITSRGAKALAFSLKNSSLLSLHLQNNQIENDGIEALAKSAEDTFISSLSVWLNPGDRLLLLDTVLWRNKVSGHQLVNAFKKITSKTCDNTFCFDKDLSNENICAFLQTCLQLYKNICEKPSAVSVLLAQKDITLSKESIISLIVEKFPKEFCAFVVSKIEADVKQHVSLLERAESLGLEKIVELLLLNRPLYAVDKNQEILHPAVYQLLFKYKYPMFNLDIEPDGKMKIIDYYTQHTDIEGASDLISLLRGKRKY